MRDWIDDWVKTLAEQAFKRGDAATLQAAAEWLVSVEGSEPSWWAMQADALYQTQSWFACQQWSQRWLLAVPCTEAWLMMARVAAANQLTVQSWHYLKQIQQHNELSLALQQSLSALINDAQADNAAYQLATTIDAFFAAQQKADSEAIALCGEALIAVGVNEESVWLATGTAHSHAKRHREALRCLLNVQHHDGKTLAITTEAQLTLGQFDTARETIRQWPMHDENSTALAFLARCEMAQGQPARAEQWLSQALALTTTDNEVWKAVGGWITHAPSVIAMREKLRECYRDPARVNADVCAALALCELRCGATIDNGMSLYEQAIKARPTFALAHKNHGVCLFRLGRFAEAKASFQRAINAMPDYAMAWGELGVTSLKLQEHAEAERCLLNALMLKPKEISHWNNLGSMLLTCYRYHAAITCFERGLTLNPQHRQLLSNLSNAYVNVGRFADARAMLEPLLSETHDGDVTSVTNLLFTINYDPDLSSEDIIAIYKKAIAAGFPAQRYFSWPNTVDAKRKIRVGYVSADFCHHPCYHFVQPLLKNHQHDCFTVVAFSNVVIEDEKTAELKTYCDEWYDIKSLSPDQVASLLHEKAIDILVDLSGHTGGNVLPVFALKPSPVQLSWLGFGYTSGLPTMDYFLCDEEMYPVGSEAYFTERAARIDLPCFVYKPSIYAPEVVASPAQKAGVVTFGSLSRPIRLNHRCLSVWGSILQRVPNSRLILNCHAFGERKAVEEATRFFTERGISADRLDIASTSPPWPVFQKIDIALDCFPHNSGTTLFEGLLMGIPFITRRDRVSMGRLGATIARGVGHPEWVSDSDNDYIEKAVALASDIPALAQQRAALRRELLMSPLCNAADFTARVERCYRDIWTQWCTQQLNNVTNVKNPTEGKA